MGTSDLQPCQTEIVDNLDAYSLSLSEVGGQSFEAEPMLMWNLMLSLVDSVGINQLVSQRITWWENPTHVERPEVQKCCECENKGETQEDYWRLYTELQFISILGTKHERSRVVGCQA